MAIEVRITFTMQCDGCSDFLCDSRFQHTKIAGFTDNAVMYDQAYGQGWHKIGTDWYCPDCQKAQKGS